MTDAPLAIAGKSFEALKQINEYGAEYWSARALQLLLGYSQWRRFEQAIERAVSSCKTSGNPPDHHFAGAGKMIETGKGAIRDVDDYPLSRFACYLIAQNGSSHLLDRMNMVADPVRGGRYCGIVGIGFN